MRYIDADALRADWLENGWMEIKESVVETKNGTLVTRTPLVTGKGQRFFVNRILRHKEVSCSVQ